MFGNDRRDLPFLGRWQFEDPESFREIIDWPHAATRHQDRVQEAIVAEAIHAGRQSVSYSRDSNWYSAAARLYLPRDFGYRVTVGAVDRIEHLGLIDHDRKRPSPAYRFRSR